MDARSIDSVTDDRQELQRLAYGRGVDEHARDAAALRLRELDTEARRAAELVGEAPAVEPAPARRRWIAPVAVAAVVLVGAAAATIAALPPSAPQAGAPILVRTLTPTPGPTPFFTQYALPDDAALVQPDVDVQVPEWAIDSSSSPRAVLSLVGLGEGQVFVVWGSLRTTGEACLNLTATSQGVGVCVPFTEFQEQGITADRGAWSVHWDPDGSLTWEGVA